jgi:hypothetical protein
MTTTELEKLRLKLPTGYIEKLALTTGKSRGHISEVLNGKKNNLKIIDAAIELAEKEKTLCEQRKLKIESL